MLLYVTALHLVPSALAEPRLSAPAGPLGPESGATFTLVADAREILVDGCDGVELERREGDRWVRVPSTTACDGSSTGREISKELSFTIALPGPGEYRAVAAWGAGCVAGRPFALAACKTTGVVRSKPVRAEAGETQAQR